MPTMSSSANFVRNSAFNLSWLFPIVLAVTILAFATISIGAVQLEHIGPCGDIAARTAWSVASTFFLALFTFFVVLCHSCMFKAGKDGHALLASLVTTVVGIAAVGHELVVDKVPYWGPTWFGDELAKEAFKIPAVLTISQLSIGCGIWAVALIVATSAVILANETKDPEQLSRQLRVSRLLMQSAAALLVTGVALVAAIHAWPLHTLSTATADAAASPIPAASATPATSAVNRVSSSSSPTSPGASRTPPPESSPSPGEKELTRTMPTSMRARGEAVATAMNTAAGTFFSLLLGAAYLPLGIVLRQRAYIVIQPWGRAETWLTVHGFSIRPSQQFAKVLLLLGPLIASGPMKYLLDFMAR